MCQGLTDTNGPEGCGRELWRVAMQGSPHAIFVKTRNVPRIPTAFHRGTVGSVVTEGPEENRKEKVDIGPKARSRLSR